MESPESPTVERQKPKPGSHAERLAQVQALMRAANVLDCANGAPLDPLLIAHTDLRPVRTAEQQLIDHLQATITPESLEVPEAEQMRDATSVAPEISDIYAIEGKQPRDIFGEPYVLPSDAITFDENGKINTWPDTLMAGSYRLRLEKLIGSGGYGSVFLARVEHDPDLVQFADMPDFNERAPEYMIVKLIAVADSDVAAEQSVMREASVLATIPHPATEESTEESTDALMLYNAHTYTLGLDGRKVYAIEMAQVQGPTGSEYLARLEQDPDRFSSERSLEIMTIVRSLVSQVRESAVRGIQHLDIKPANMMINKRHVRLTDFGSSYAIKDNDPRTKHPFTLFYSSPRLLVKQRDILADLYSAAVTGLRMLGVASESQDLKRVSTSGKPSNEELATLARERRVFSMPRLRAKTFDQVLQEQFPHQYNDAAVRKFIFLLSRIAQPEALPGLMVNPFGSMEHTQENLLQTIDAFLAETDPLIAEQQTNVNRDVIIATWFQGNPGKPLLDHIPLEKTANHDPDATRQMTNEISS